jgi:TetR/AcrR family transcriptional regulator, transcriptional repressor for nem operon
MARYQPEHKAKTRQKLVESAVTAFRRNGIDSAGLKEIMREMGLTVGGFYRHFESKSELVQSALALGLAQSIERMRQASGEQPGNQRATNDGQSIERFAARYLSETHRRSIAQGCVLAALASDIARSDREVKAVCEVGLRRVHAELRRQLPGDADQAADHLWGLMALEVGGLLLSRMVACEQTATEILKSCRRTVKTVVRPTAKRERLGRRMRSKVKRAAKPA